MRRAAPESSGVGMVPGEIPGQGIGSRHETPRHSSRETWLSTSDICHRYGITEQTWRKTWPSWPVLAGSVRRFRSTPESGGKRRWPESAVQAWWETSSR